MKVWFLLLYLLCYFFSDYRSDMILNEALIFFFFFFLDELGKAALNIYKEVIELFQGTSVE